MFSDVVSVANALLSLNQSAFVLVLMFLLVFWVSGKLLRSWILDRHWALLLLVAILIYAIAMQKFLTGQYILAFLISLPLLFLGREGYRRLVP
jgi:hypothetical protein